MIGCSGIARTIRHLASSAVFACCILPLLLIDAVGAAAVEVSTEPEVVWVTFRDKRLQDAAWRSVARENAEKWISARSRLRRVKRARLSAPLGERDYPVNAEYIRKVLDTGAQKRMESRWFNAITVRASSDQIKTISQLPFVLSIDPARKTHRKRELMPTPTPVVGAVTASQVQSTSATLNYADCFNQLNQINVVAAHSAGFNGAGVVIGLMDGGFSKSHEALASRLVIKEWDFIFNDDSVQSDPDPILDSNLHGTAVWSLVGGFKDGAYIGVAFNASFLLARTEDVRSETPVEEDYWVAGMEWLEANGADIVNSSLGYMEFDSGYPSHIYEELDGKTLKPSIAAGIAASLGVLVCNSIGNEGPSTGTLSTPADARDILTCGAVDSTGTIASFSSRGPAADGRIKPEVCALGKDAYVAVAVPLPFKQYSKNSGTSYSSPIVAGAAALVLQAHPNWTPAQVREALMMTASQSAAPDNVFGWGVIDVMAAIAYSPPTDAGNWTQY